MIRVKDQVKNNSQIGNKNCSLRDWHYIKSNPNSKIKN